jgi:S1-C subfamily serine protease
MNSSSSEVGASLLAFSNGLAAAVDRAGRSVVAVNARPRVPSSGILWRPGVVVATNHTIQRDEEITVTFPDGRTSPAKLAGRDPSTDIAALKLEGNGQTKAETGDASTLRVGHVVLAVGRSGGNSIGASLGIISSLGGAWRTSRGGQIDRFIRLDAAIYLGFSGSALVSADGSIVGVNTSGLGRGMALAIPASTVNRVVDELLTKGHIARGYLGIGTQPVRLPDALRAKLNLARNVALIVVSVEPESPADKAGLLIGDVLVSLEGAPVNDIADVQAKLGPEWIGKTLATSVLRAGSLTPLSIRVAERSERVR